MPYSGVFEWRSCTSRRPVLDRHKSNAQSAHRALAGGAVTVSHVRQSPDLRCLRASGGHDSVRHPQCITVLGEQCDGGNSTHWAWTGGEGSFAVWQPWKLPCSCRPRHAASHTPQAAAPGPSLLPDPHHHPLHEVNEVSGLGAKIQQHCPLSVREVCSSRSPPADRSFKHFHMRLGDEWCGRLGALWARMLCNLAWQTTADCHKATYIARP